jgi:hypothetical protein
MKSFISPCIIDEILYNISVPGNLNAYSIGNPMNFPANSYNIFTSIPLVPENVDSGNGLPSWLGWAVSGGQVLAGIGLMFVPGGQLFGGMLIAGGSLGLVSNAFGNQIGGGIGSMLSGGGAFATGVSLLGFGPVGWIVGGALMIVGAGTFSMGANEVAQGVTGTNYIQEWTGMSDGLYDGLYLGLNIASAAGQIAGHLYMSSNAGKLAQEIQQNSKYWHRGSFKTRYGSLKYHFSKHGAGLTPKGYTQSALNFAARNASMLKYTYNFKYGNTSWFYNYLWGHGGHFTGAGRIITFW